MPSELDKEQRNPDFRSTFYVYLAMPIFSDPQRVYQEALDALEGYMDSDTLFGAAFPLFHRLGKTLPRIPILVGTLNDPSIKENEAGYMLRVLTDTGSIDSYRAEVEALLEKFPNLKTIFH